MLFIHLSSSSISISITEGVSSSKIGLERKKGGGERHYTECFIQAIYNVVIFYQSFIIPGTCSHPSQVIWEDVSPAGANKTAANGCGVAVRCWSWAEVGLPGTPHAKGLWQCSLGYVREQDHCMYSRTGPTVNRKSKHAIVQLWPAGTNSKSPVAPVIKAEGLKFHPICKWCCQCLQKGKVVNIVTLHSFKSLFSFPLLVIPGVTG